MKRISRVVLLTIFGLLLIAGTQAYAGKGGKGDNGNNQGQNDNGKGKGDNYGDDNDQGKNNQGDDNGYGHYQGTDDGGIWANGGGGGTAPITGGIGLLLAAGIGLGIRKVAGQRQSA